MTTMSPEARSNRRGLLKLMLRMPALRGRLQTLSAMNDDVMSLCGAFEDATVTLDKLRRDWAGGNRAAIVEYEELCQEIEKEIVEICSR
jgi:hypothetical protein